MRSGFAVRKVFRSRLLVWEAIPEEPRDIRWFLVLRGRAIPLLAAMGSIGGG